MHLAVRELGEVPYQAACALQEELVGRCASGESDVLLLLEHPPVYTLGRGADPAFLGDAADGPVPALRTSRGGQVTYHGPGQLVGYPIVDLRRHRPDVRWYVRQLERVLIEALATWGVAGERRAGAPGVWVAGRKIASIGIGIRRWVAWHGFALNVGPDVSPFRRITPCGLAGIEMTSLALEGGPDRLADVVPTVRDAFVRVLGYRSWAVADSPGRPRAGSAP